MKVFVLTIMLAAMSTGLAMAGGGYGSCVGNNSKACRDARDAFASHHGGMFPGQYRYNHPYYNRDAYQRGYWNGERAEEREEHEHHHHEHHHDRDDW
jgi:hypothetical protein